MATSKIYTKTGDSGKTSLLGGQRVAKDHPRVTAYGSVDELNAALGFAASFSTSTKIKKVLTIIQNELFNIGAELSSPKKIKNISHPGTFFQLEKEEITKLEKHIDEFDAKLPKLNNFILPTGTKAATSLHLARTICRRAEREVTALAEKTEINPHLMAYLNRLSDLLFVLARTANAGFDKPWKK